MLRLRIFPVILPFLFLVTIPRTQQTAEHPNVTTKNFENPFRCFNDSSFHERTRKFLEEFVRNRAKPHISMLQKLNNQINGEIDYYVEHLKWSTIQRMTKENPKFTIRGSVEFHFADFAQVIRKFIFLQSDIGEVQIKRQIHRSLRDFLIHVFPSAFLCLPMGSCKSPSANYINCLSRNANTWQKTFFDIDSDAIANEITVSIKRYRKVQRSSDEAYAVLLQASENLDENCLEEFAEFRFCETAVFCPDLCVRRARECFRLIGEKWAKKLFELKMLAKNFGEEFKKVENDMLGIFFSHHLLQPTTVAELAFKKCGSLRQTREEGANEAYVIPNREKPKAFHKGTEHMVEKLIGASIDLWNRASTAVCPLKLAPQQECFNGTQFIVPSAHIAPAADAEAHLKKDVAEAPSAHRRIASVVSTSAEHNNYEGSGSFDWSDDEDLALEGSGSGSPPIIEDVTPSEPPPRIEIVPEIRMAEKPSTASPPTVPRDSIDVIEVQATTTRSSNAISYSIVAPILTAFFALRFVGF